MSSGSESPTTDAQQHVRRTGDAAIRTATTCSSSKVAGGIRRGVKLLHKIQQLTIDRVMFAPIMGYRRLRGVGPRIAEDMLESMPLIPFSAYEDMRLKSS